MLKQRRNNFVERTCSMPCVDAEVGAILTITAFPNTDTTSTLVDTPGVSGACALPTYLLVGTKGKCPKR